MRLNRKWEKKKYVKKQENFIVEEKRAFNCDALKCSDPSSRGAYDVWLCLSDSHDSLTRDIELHLWVYPFLCSASCRSKRYRKSGQFHHDVHDVDLSLQKFPEFEYSSCDWMVLNARSVSTSKEFSCISYSSAFVRFRVLLLKVCVGTKGCVSMFAMFVA